MFVDSKFIDELFINLNNPFGLKNLGELSIFFLGIEAKRNEDRFLLTQGKYAIDLLKKIGIQECKNVSTLMT